MAIDFDRLATALRAAGYASRRWTKGAHDRLYVTTAKGKGCGYVDVAGGRVGMGAACESDIDVAFAAAVGDAEDVAADAAERLARAESEARARYA